MVSTHICYSRRPGLHSQQIGMAVLTEDLSFLCPFRRLLELLHRGHDSCLSHSVQSIVAVTATYACSLLHTGFLLGLLFRPEDAIDMLLRNVGWLSRTTRCFILEDRALQSRRITTCYIETLRLGMFYVGFVGNPCCWAQCCFSLLMIQRSFLRSAANQKLSLLNGTSF
jgi:hypothetical protein